MSSTEQQADELKELIEFLSDKRAPVSWAAPCTRQWAVCGWELASGVPAGGLKVEAAGVGVRFQTGAGGLPAGHTPPFCWVILHIHYWA